MFDDIFFLKTSVFTAQGPSESDFKGVCFSCSMNTFDDEAPRWALVSPQCPKIAPRWSQASPKMAQDAPKVDPSRPKVFQK